MPKLWPDDLVRGDLVVPLTILQEQAMMLATITDGLVKADVRLMQRVTESTKEKKANDEFIYGFYLLAPLLDNYSYRLFMIFRDATLFPVYFQVDQEIERELDSLRLLEWDGKVSMWRVLKKNSYSALKQSLEHKGRGLLLEQWWLRVKL